MAYPDPNFVNGLGCSQFALVNDSSGNINIAYLNCGDLTPIVVQNTGGSANAVYAVVSGVYSSAVVTTGSLSAGASIGGYDQRYVPYAQVVTVVTSLTSIPTGNYSG